MNPRPCIDYSLFGYRSIAWLNAHGLHHLFDMREPPFKPRCWYARHCLICRRWVPFVEKDPEERLAQHRWEWMGDAWRRMTNGTQKTLPGLFLPHQLHCNDCYAVWDSVPDGKEKLY